MTLFEDSVLMYDAGRREQDSPYHPKCKACRTKEENLKPSNPLIFLCNQDRSFSYCRDCLDKYVQDNTKLTHRSNGLIEYAIDNLYIPETGKEFARKVIIGEQSVETIRYPTAIGRPPYYIVIERKSYDGQRPPGHIEGYVLRYGISESEEDNLISFGSDPECDAFIPGYGLHQKHFSVGFEDGVFVIVDHSGGSTVVKKYGKIILNDYRKSITLVCDDHILSLSSSSDKLKTPEEHRDHEVSLYTYEHKEEDDIYIDTERMEDVDLEKNKKAVYERTDVSDQVSSFEFIYDSSIEENVTVNSVKHKRHKVLKR